MLPFDIKHADLKKITRQIFEDDGLSREDSLTLVGYLTKMLQRNEFLKLKLDTARAMLDERKGLDHKKPKE